MLKNLGLPELIVIALIALLFFGKDKLPGLAKGVGESITEFKTALNPKEEEKPSVVTRKKTTKTKVKTKTAKK